LDDCRIHAEKKGMAQCPGTHRRMGSMVQSDVL